MSEELTNVDTDTSESDGKNTGNTEGAENNQTATNTDDMNKETNKGDDVQAKIDAAIKARLAEEKARERKRTDDAISKAKEEWEKDKDKAIADAIEAYKAEAALVAVKESIKSEYGLTDEQVARLSGDDEKSLKDDASKIFGAFRKKDAPNLNPGNKTTTNSDDYDAIITNALGSLGRR